MNKQDIDVSRPFISFFLSLNTFSSPLPHSQRARARLKPMILSHKCAQAVTCAPRPLPIISTLRRRVTCPSSTLQISPLCRTTECMRTPISSIHYYEPIRGSFSSVLDGIDVQAFICIVSGISSGKKPRKGQSVEEGCLLGISGHILAL